MEDQDQGNVEAADQGYAGGVAEKQGFAVEVGGQLIEDAKRAPALAEFGEAGVDVAELADRAGDRRHALEGGRGAEAEQGGAFNGGFKQGRGLSDLGEEEAGGGVGLVFAGFQRGGETLHF